MLVRFAIVCLTLFLAAPLWASWPPRNGSVFGNGCKDALFFQAAAGHSIVEQGEFWEAQVQGPGSEEAIGALRFLRGVIERGLGELPKDLSTPLETFYSATQSGMPPSLAEFLLGPEPSEPGWHFAVDARGDPCYKGKSYKTLVHTRPDVLNTSYFHSRDGWLPEGSPLVVPVLAGVGAEHSHAGSVFALLNLLLSKKSKSGSTLGKLKEQGLHLPVNPFAFDLPNNGTAFRDPGFTDLDLNVDYLTSALMEPLAQVRRQGAWGARGRPRIVPIARSASPSLLMEMHQRQPGLLSGILMASPLHPADLDISDSTLDQLIEKGVYKENQIANRWISELYRQMTWHEKPDPFSGDLPVLILGGTEDPEETKALGPKVGWDIYRRWEAQFPHKVRFIILEGVGHDPFDVRDRDKLLRVMRYVYRFFQFVLNGETDMRKAFPIEPGEIRAPWREIFGHDFESGDQ